MQPCFQAGAQARSLHAHAHYDLYSSFRNTPSVPESGFTCQAGVLLLLFVGLCELVHEYVHKPSSQPSLSPMAIFLQCHKHQEWVYDTVVYAL